MATVELPQKLLDDTILIVDDEPEHIQWLFDYIEAKGMKIHVMNNVEDAINAANRAQYRAYVIDLNIPMGNWTPTFLVPNDVYDKYKGFYVIKYVRTQGNLGKNVSAYSAHYNEQIIAETKTLYCEYTSKDRVQDFKKEIANIIATPIDSYGVIKSTTV